MANKVNNSQKILDKLVISLYLQGNNIKQIAELINKSRRTVERRLEKPEVKEYIEQHQQQALDVLLESQTEAALKLKEQLESSDERISQGAAKEILKGVLSDSVKIPEGIKIVFENKTKE